jgi:hypothetical protein
MHNEINVNALIVRALKTFVQAFCSVLAVSAATVVDVDTGKAVLIGAVAAGISAVMNLIIAPQESK